MHQSERVFRAHAKGQQVRRRAGLTGSCCRGAGHDEGRKRVRKGFQGRIFLSACCRFCPGTAYIVCLGKQIVLLLGRLLPSGGQSNRRRSMVHTSLALIERHLWTADDPSWHHHSLLLCLSVIAMGSAIAPASALNTASSPRAHLSRLYLAQPSLVLLR